MQYSYRRSKGTGSELKVLAENGEKKIKTSKLFKNIGIRTVEDNTVKYYKLKGEKSDICEYGFRQKSFLEGSGSINKESYELLDSSAIEKNFKYQTQLGKVENVEDLKHYAQNILNEVLVDEKSLIVTMLDRIMEDVQSLNDDVMKPVQANIEKILETLNNVSDINNSIDDIKKLTQLIKDITEKNNSLLDRFAEQYDKVICRLESIDSRTERIEGTTERIDDRTERIDGRTERIEDTTERIDDRTDRIDGKTERIDSRTKRIEGTTERIDDRTERIEGTTERTDSRVERMENRLGKMEENIINKIDEKGSSEAIAAATSQGKRKVLTIGATNSKHSLIYQT
ncbi:uncharacterized protein TRIADDRAFT_62074 [Trichoplax adhaerens]|uniref:t-SNARE coiled-coil homology domain-containing protein n=1 Tax=Trichoplax adhaerens TaxID=10228 RepID=B3SCR9_TRIAD|nr:predicted protein [Trichoplax adhaerens]EDV19458.1 predicted protein [Trichoplax adhaerens]|eukprot:XP_002118058.1 predicted protein [Trichoplax adhaerens]